MSADSFVSLDLTRSSMRRNLRNSNFRLASRPEQEEEKGACQPAGKACQIVVEKLSHTMSRSDVQARFAEIFDAGPIYVSPIYFEDVKLRRNRGSCVLEFASPENAAIAWAKAKNFARTRNSLPMQLQGVKFIAWWLDEKTASSTTSKAPRYVAPQQSIREIQEQLATERNARLKLERRMDDMAKELHNLKLNSEEGVAWPPARGAGGISATLSPHFLFRQDENDEDNGQNQGASGGGGGNRYQTYDNKPACSLGEKGLAVSIYTPSSGTYVRNRRNRRNSRNSRRL